MRDLPIACTLSPAELGARRDALLPGLIGLATSRQPLDDGYRFTFDAVSDRLSHIARVIDVERQCCRFLKFQLTVDQAGVPFTLDVTGPEGTKEFLDALGVD
jgi:hypothetical protein